MEQFLFINGYDINFDDSLECEQYLSLQGMDEKTAMKFSFYDKRSSPFRLSFLDGKAYKFEEIEFGEFFEWNNVSINDDFMFREIPHHQISLLTEKNSGIHFYGGSAKEQSVILPKHPKTQTHFNYIGCLNRKDEVFNWLPMDRLHLVFPLLTWAQKIYLDYENSLSPKLIDLFDFNYSSDEEIQSKHFVEFNQIFFETTPLYEIEPKEITPDFKCIEVDGDIGHIGIPTWLQHPEIPICPKSGDVMRFVAMLDSDEMSTSISNTNLSDKQIKKYAFQNMFDGWMYIFMNPEEKTVCIFTQNT